MQEENSGAGTDRFSEGVGEEETPFSDCAVESKVALIFQGE